MVAISLYDRPSSLAQDYHLPELCGQLFHGSPDRLLVFFP